MEPTPPPPVSDTTITGTGTVTVHEEANDTINVRIVLMNLGLIVAASLVCSTILTMAGWSPPEWMGNLAIGCAGGLMGVLAKTSSKRT